MSSIVLAQVAYAYSPSRPVLTATSLTLSRGWTGCVGTNGSGKSTLIDLIRGELTPDEGSIRSNPVALVCEHCPQRVDEVSAAIRTFAERSDGRAAAERGRLDLDPEALQRWSDLSPGERKRWQIAAALATDPHALLLDEPTNHVDDEVRQRTIEALMRFRGIGIVVTHDRLLLNQLTATTIRVHRTVARSYRGPYDEARNEWLRAEEHDQGAFEQLKNKERRVRERLGDRRRDRAAAQVKTRWKNRANGIRDNDARSSAAKGRARHGEKRMSHQVRLERERLSRVEAQRAQFDRTKDLGRDFDFRFEAPRKRLMLRAEGPTLMAGDKRLASTFALDVERDDRIWIAGPNGAGKSTLLEGLIGGSCIPADKLLVLPQELAPETALELRNTARTLRPDERGRVSTILAGLGADPDVVLASDRPSPGEARKLALALGMGRECWVLALDEPTNHLDLDSIERLELALGQWPGALVLVTHDERLARASTRVRWLLGGDAIVTSRW